MSKTQMKKQTLISLLIGFSLFVSLFLVPFILKFTGGISDPNYTFGESFGISFTCFALGIMAIVYTPLITWFSFAKNKNVNLWGCSLFGFFFVILILGSGLAIPFTLWQVNQERRDMGEIVILNDRDYKSLYGFSGDGSENNPFLIENLHINTTKTYGIYIRNSKNFFLIRNCTIHASRNTIYVRGTAFGNCKIIDNQLFHGTLLIENSIALSLENNTVQNKIDISNCSLARIINNKCGYLKIDFSDQVLVNNNRITTGLLICCSGYSTISNNIINNCTNPGLRVLNVYNLLIVNNTSCNNRDGIFIDSSELVTVLGNNFSSNVNTGVTIKYSINITLSSNYIQKNQNGLFFDDNHFVILTRNLFANNTEYGIYVEYIGYLNLFYQNNFYYNNLAGMPSGIAQVFENTSLPHYHDQAIYWYDISTNGGNYWSDIVWNEGVIYEIDGGNNTDPYPLENPVSL